MGTIDLKPLTKETIEQLALDNHDLWMIKIGEDIQGPFESESLKHYAADNESSFDNAFATRIDQYDWQPFFSHALFQRRKPAVIEAASATYKGPFWIMIHGMKSVPLSKEDIDRKIDMNLLSMTDLISCDDGQEWKKIHQIELYERRGHRPTDLPLAPLESSFEQAKLELVEQIENNQASGTLSSQEGLASLAYLSHDTSVTKVIIDDITLDSVQETEISRSLKWAVPTAIAGCIVLVVTGMYVFSPDKGTLEMASSQEAPEVIVPTPANPRPIQRTPERSPSSHGRSLLDAGRNAINSPRYQPTSHSQYPTHVETHQNDHHPGPEQMPETDPMEDMDRNPAQEHSLVNGANNNNEEGMTVDEAMSAGNIPVPDQPQEAPVMEEASDF